MCLAGLFQLPGTSRSRPSTLYEPKYYEPIFKEINNQKIGSLVEELLYINHYYNRKDGFKDRFKKEFDKKPNSDTLLRFASAARTACIAFAVLAGRYIRRDIKDEDIEKILSGIDLAGHEERCRHIFLRLDKMTPIFSAKLFANKDAYDDVL